jgi:hypothetical protein
MGIKFEINASPMKVGFNKNSGKVGIAGYGYAIPQYKIYILGNSIARFKNIISPYIIPSMIYKL